MAWTGARATVRGWYYVSVDEQNNPDIRDYYGYGELRADYGWTGNSAFRSRRPLLSMALHPAKRSAIEMNFSIAPIKDSPNFRLLVQYPMSCLDRGLHSFV